MFIHNVSLNFKRIFLSCVMCALSVWAVAPLFSDGFFPMHDDTQVGRVVAMGRALQHGQFPVRWVSDLGYGYGYPIFNFYGPLPYYVGGIVYAFGTSGLIATKVMFCFGIVLAGLTFFWSVYPVLGLFGATVGSIFYLYAPYHAVQIYVRGAVGEFWSLIFLPLIVGALVHTGGYKKQILIGGFGLAGVIYSHTIMGFLTVIFFVALALSDSVMHVVRHTHWQRCLIRYGGILMVGLGLSASFWLPAFMEMKYTNVFGQVGPTADFHTHFVCASQLWNSLWGYGGSSPGCLDGMSFKLGKIHLLVASVVFLLSFFAKKRSSLTRFIQITGVIVIISLFLTNAWSVRIWEAIPFFAFVQYPWRLLTFAMFGLSLLCGASVSCMTGFKRYSIGIVLVISVLFLEAKWFVPQFLYARDSASFETSEELRWRVSKISDEYLPQNFIRPTDAAQVPTSVVPSSAYVTVTDLEDKNTSVRGHVVANSSHHVTLNKAYFPGWQYRIDGHVVFPEIRQGLPVLVFPDGTHTFEATLMNSPVRTLANMVSFLTSGMVLVWLFMPVSRLSYMIYHKKRFL